MRGSSKEIKADKKMELENHNFRSQNVGQDFDSIGIKIIH